MYLKVNLREIRYLSFCTPTGPIIDRDKNQIILITLKTSSLLLFNVQLNLLAICTSVQWRAGRTLRHERFHKRANTPSKCTENNFVPQHL